MTSVGGNSRAAARTRWASTVGSALAVSISWVSRSWSCKGPKEDGRYQPPAATVAVIRCERTTVHPECGEHRDPDRPSTMWGRASAPWRTNHTPTWHRDVLSVVETSHGQRQRPWWPRESLAGNPAYVK